MVSREPNPSWDPPRQGRWPWFGAFAFLFLVASQTVAIVTSPPDRDMGDLEKILYVHVPAAWIMSLTFAVVMFYSLRYLWKGRETDDLAAASAAEVGTLVLFLIFVGYLSLRAFVDEPERRAQWSAAVGILGAINVPIVYMSVRWWRTLHQVQSSPDTVAGIYVLSLRANAFAFLFVMIYLVRRRYEAACLDRAADHAEQAAALGGR